MNQACRHHVGEVVDSDADHEDGERVFGSLPEFFRYKILRLDYVLDRGSQAYLPIANQEGRQRREVERGPVD